MARSVFEIIGPVMIGPSSSHTAGMARIGSMAFRILNMEPVDIHLDLSPKMRTTYSGHRSDAALFGGAMGYNESSDEIRNAIRIAHEKGITTSVGFMPEGKYPQNTAKVVFTSENGEKHSVTGTSVGGGSIRILEVEDVHIELEADLWNIVLWTMEELPAVYRTEDCRFQSGHTNNLTANCFVNAMSFIEKPAAEFIRELQELPGLIRFSLAEPVLVYGGTQPSYMSMSSCTEAIRLAKEQGISLAEAAVRYEMKRSGKTHKEIVGLMQEQLQVMKESVKKGQEENRLLYGLTSGHDGKMLAKAVAEGRTISQGIIPKAVSMAIGVMELNGSMGCIVAAPTAGSSGIVPGSVVAVQNTYHLTDEQMIDALFVSALMGVIMAEKGVSFSGSVGGCQGEIGVSSAITAAGLASLFTDDPEAICHAMALCMKNLLGLVCDPIAGPIEVPCIKRNAVGVANAFISADLALAGIRSYIPPDEVIDALIDVEERLPGELKCATIGGLACTKTAVCTRHRLGQ